MEHSQLEVRLSFANVACLDPANGRLGVIESIAASWKATSPVAGRLLLLFILMGIITLGTLLLLIVGVIFLGYPLWIAIFGAAYSMVFAGHHARLAASSHPHVPPQAWPAST